MKTRIFLLIVFLPVILFSQGKLTTESRGLFSGSGNCGLCHSGNFKAHIIKGKDVSPITQWRSTMMANASKDPFWKAKVETELSLLKNEKLRKIAGDMCLKCHTPMSYTDAVNNNSKNYSFEKIYTDGLSQDGVSCSLCHQISKENLGMSDSYGGNYIIGKSRIIWGPYENVLEPPMINHENYTPKYSGHLKKSELCATCHTVITPFIDENENVSGVFFEQTPYIEWKNSSYPENGISCQSCHMPEIADSVDISSVPPPHEVYRSPYWYHIFAGGNNTLQKIFLKNGFELGLTSTKENHEATLKEVETNLNENSLSLSAKSVYSDSFLNIDISIENLTGHKLPTGIPFRRMWIHLFVKDITGNILFESGDYDETGKINGHDMQIEPHYNFITDENQVQIYEGVMVDMNGNPTQSLLLASKFGKDNRIPPVGFKTSFISYDTIAIYGNALTDEDFNKAEVTEGTGIDIIHYKIPAKENIKYIIEIEICYQSIKPEIIDYFKKFSLLFSNSFINMYKNSDIKPSIIGRLKID